MSSKARLQSSSAGSAKSGVSAVSQASTDEALVSGPGSRHESIHEHKTSSASATNFRAGSPATAKARQKMSTRELEAEVSSSDAAGAAIIPPAWWPPGDPFDSVHPCRLSARLEKQLKWVRPAFVDSAARKLPSTQCTGEGVWWKHVHSSEWSLILLQLRGVQMCCALVSSDLKRVEGGISALLTSCAV